jgi:hypothetical protein
LASKADGNSAFLQDILRTYRNYEALGEGAMAQVSDADLFRAIDADANSIAILVKHVGGNLKSRFTDFLTTDGEKPDRDRDAEFDGDGDGTRAQVNRWWDAGWNVVNATLNALTPEDLSRTVRIRGEEFLVVEALNRSANHTAYHVGQMVLLAKHFAGPNWKSLSIPKGQSKNFGKGQFKSGIIPKR